LSSRNLPNNKGGLQKLIRWVMKLTKAEVKILFAIEATGVYHERAAEYLFDKGMSVSVLVPRRVSNFTKSLEIKTITDDISALAIAHFGLLKKLELWKKPDQINRYLRDLTREREQLMQERSSVKNMLHAEQAGAWGNPNAIARMKSHIAFLDKQIKEIEHEIDKAVDNNKPLKEKLKVIQSIKGVGLITAVTIVSETDGFSLILNSRQLVSYAGLDVIQKQSGTSVRGKPRISHRGNRHIRKALHFPALTAIRHDLVMRGHFSRLVSRHGIKMKAAVAVQRKILVLVYTLWKTNNPYDPNYEANKQKCSGRPSLVSPMELDLVRS